MTSRGAMRGSAMVLTVALGLGCVRAPRNAAPAVPPDFDHVVVATNDFARGVAALEAATGVPLSGDWIATAGIGGADVGGPGVRAALLPLGAGRFVELVGPAADSTSSRELAGVFGMYPTPTPIGWAVRTANVDTLRRRLTARALRPGEPQDGVLTTTAGAAFPYRGVEGWPRVSTLMPFFVEWAGPRGSPLSTQLAQCALVHLVLNYPAPDSLAARIERASVHVAVQYGRANAQGIHVTLRCPAGTVELPLPAS